MDFHIAVEIPPSTETGKRTGFRFNAWSAALSGMWKMRSKSRISLTSTCWCVLRKKNPQTKEWLIPSEIHDQIMQNLWFEFPHPFPKGMECWDTSMVVNVDPTAFAVVLFFSTSCFPPKQRLKRCVSRCSKRTMTFLQDQGNSKSTWVRQWKVSVKNSKTIQLERVVYRIPLGSPFSPRNALMVARTSQSMVWAIMAHMTAWWRTPRKRRDSQFTSTKLRVAKIWKKWSQILGLYISIFKSSEVTPESHACVIFQRNHWGMSIPFANG